MIPLQFIASLRAAIEASRSPRGPTLVAIDGPGCSGKTTLASALEAAWGDEAISIGTDGFFIPFGKGERIRARCGSGVVWYKNILRKTVLMTMPRAAHVACHPGAR